MNTTPWPNGRGDLQPALALEPPPCGVFWGFEGRGSAQEGGGSQLAPGKGGWGGGNCTHITFGSNEARIAPSWPCTTQGHQVLVLYLKN